MHARLRGPNNLFIPHQIINRTWFLLSDEIAKTRPDMNIKVAAFTVSEKSINTGKLLVSSSLMSYKEYYGSPGGTFIANDL